MDIPDFSLICGVQAHRDLEVENDKLRAVIDDLRDFIGDTFYVNGEKPLPNSWYKGTSKVYGVVLDEIMARVPRKAEKQDRG